VRIAALAALIAAVAAGTSTAATGRDVRRPTKPTGLAVVAKSQTSVTIRWRAARDNVGVRGYRWIVNGRLVGSGRAVRHTFASLACGRAQRFAIVAFDRAGNRSRAAVLTTATAACPATPLPSPTVFVASTGSDVADCSRAAPCATLDRAFRVARPGAVVEVAGGAYPAQAIQPKPGAAAPAVVFRAARGASPSFADLDVRASHVHLLGPFATRGLSTSNSRERVRGSTVENITVDARGGSATPGYVAHVDGVTWRNVEIHNAREANALLMIDGGYPARGAVSNLVLDGLRLHDATIAPGSRTHTQCIFLGGGQNVTLRNSAFWNCTTFDVFVTTAGGDLPRNLLFENNMFGAPYLHGTECCHAYAVRFRDSAPLDGLVFRYNTAQEEIGWPRDSVAGGGARVVANAIQGGMLCKAGIRFASNVTTSRGPCSSDGRRVRSIGFANAAAHDLHLLPSSPAIDAGSRSEFPGTDIDGQARPVGAAPDAGADERR
jgi:hypothetical protein